MPPLLVLGHEQRRVLPFLGGEFLIELRFRRTGGCAGTAFHEVMGGALLASDGDAQEVAGVARTVVDARERAARSTAISAEGVGACA